MPADLEMSFLMRLFPALTAVLGSLVTTVLLAPVSPALAGSTQPDPDEVVTVAHRGARSVAPENTLVALDVAADQDADFVEVDVRRTRDGRLVLLHDDDLTRTTNVEKVFPKRRSYAVGDFTYRDLRRLDAGSWKAKRYAGERIPTLKQAVRLVQDRGIGIIIELKSPAIYPGIESDVSVALRQVHGFFGKAVRRERLVVQSFDFAAARTFKDLEPRVELALLGTPAVTDLPGLAQWADEISARHKTVDANYVAAVHATGMDCSVWTVDAPENMSANLDKGVDGVVTNRPNVLGQVLLDRSSS